MNTATTTVDLLRAAGFVLAGHGENHRAFYKRGDLRISETAPGYVKRGRKWVKDDSGKLCGILTSGVYFPEPGQPQTYQDHGQGYIVDLIALAETL